MSNIKDKNRMSPNEVAKWLRLDPFTIRQWIRRGIGGKKLRATKLGGRWYTSRKRVKEFLRELKQPQEPGELKTVVDSRTRKANQRALDEFDRRYGKQESNQ